MNSAFLLQSNVLKLNSSWQPMTYISVEEALTKIFNTQRDDALLPVDIQLDADGSISSHSRVISTPEWLTFPVEEGDPFIGLPHGRKLRVPFVVITPTYSRLPEVKLQMNKRGLFIREHGHCGYCNVKLTLDEGTIEHIIPRDQDGPTTWENCVLACKPCNGRKRNRTPEQAKMPLLVKPHKPKPRPMAPHLSGSERPEHLALLQLAA